MALNLAVLYQQGVDFLLKQAAEWARIPTRLSRVEAARVIVEQAALQKNDVGTLAMARGAATALQQVRSLYDNGSGKVADVVDQVRALPPGSIPPVSLGPKAAEVAAIVAAVTKGLTTIERNVATGATKVLTPEQLDTLKRGGLTFPSFLGGQAMTLVKYALFGIPIYLLLTGKAGRSRTRL
jgi:hypothetical protein